MRLGKLFGISIELHATFIWLAIIVVALLAILSPANFFPIVILLFFLFFSVFLHELVHSVISIEKGIKVERIILLPIGGMSIAEELPEKPWDEFIIAVAGPLFNFLVAFAILVLAAFFRLPFPGNWLQLFIASPLEFEAAVLTYPLLALFYVNLILGAFNLFVPALPLDGGRVARAALAALLGYSRATRIITKVSTAFAIFLFLLGFFMGSLIMIVIAVFIYFGARQENEIAEIKEILRGTEIMQLINRKPVVLDANQTVQEAFELMQQHNRIAFLVELPGGRFAVVDVNSIAAVPKEKWNETALRGAGRNVPAVKPNAAAGDALVKILAGNFSILPVAEHGILLGIVEAAELRKLFELQRLQKGK